MENDEKVKVFFSGYIFARILNCAAKSLKLEDGILYGESNMHTFSSITDSQQKDVHKEEITVQSTIPLNSSFSFYNQFGEVDEHKLTLHLKEKNVDDAKSFIGWYRVRRCTSPCISLRERTVIKSLLDGNVFQHDIATPTYEENQSTHNFIYKCFLCKKGQEPMSIKTSIMNLGDESTGQQNKYKRRSRLIEEGGNSSFGSLLRDKESSKFFDVGTGSSVLADNTYSLFKKTCMLMKNLQEQVTDSNHEVEECRREIEKIENKNKRT